MRKVFIIFLFSVIWGNLSGQASNQLNQFVLESVCHFAKDYNAFAKRVNHDTIRYVWSNGLPEYFPCDSLPCEVFYIAKMEGDRSQKKRIQTFCKSRRNHNNT